MQFEYMSEFLAVVDSGSISEAANRTFQAQPVLSKHIKSLEAELGVELLVRSHSGVSLTEAGKSAYKTFSDMTSLYNGLRERLRRDKDGTGLLRVGMLNLGVGHYVLPTATRLQEKYPGVEVRYSTKKPDEIVNGVLNGSFDVAFLGGIGSEWDAELSFFPIANQEVFFLISRKHPRAMADCIEASDLSGHPLLCLRNQPSTEFMNSLILGSGIVPSSIVGIDELELVPSRVVGDDAFFAMPTFMLERFGVFTDTSIVRFRPTLFTQLSFIYNEANANPAIELFLESAKELKSEGHYKDPYAKESQL